MSEATTAAAIAIWKVFHMAFNGSGTFVRLFNWVTDKANTVPVTASRMDSEMDGMATGLSTSICKDGQTTTTARVPFTLGVSSMAGAAGGASYSQINDNDTGIYFPATNSVAVTCGGTTGFTVTGTTMTISVPVSVSAGTLGGNPITAFPSGTGMLFRNSSAPTGWTKSVAINDSALRLVSGNLVDGGSTNFSSVFAARSIAQANLPVVQITVTGTCPAPTIGGGAALGVAAGSGTTTAGGATFNTYDSAAFGALQNTSLTSGATAALGSGTTMDFAVKFTDVIIATKD